MKNVLVVTAHPDDETIWCGGTILREKQEGNHVTVLCCSIPRNETARALDFYLACNRLGVDHTFLSPYVKSDPRQPLELIWLPAFLDRLRLDREVHRIYTHGVHGEYGHRHHKHVHEVVTRVTVDWDGTDVWCFYPPNPEIEIAFTRTSPRTHEIDFNDKDYALRAYQTHPGREEKHQALKRVYPWAFNDYERFTKWVR
jgi:LmbE family N-acetylglucosaminyl deacetylase